MKNMQYQAKKNVRAETNLKNIEPKKYHDFFDIFSKKKLDTFFPNQKYNHKIHLEKEQKLAHVLLYKISP